MESSTSSSSDDQLQQLPTDKKIKVETVDDDDKGQDADESSGSDCHSIDITQHGTLTYLHFGDSLQFFFLSLSLFQYFEGKKEGIHWYKIT